ncbi:MAG: putative Fe-S cluster assembly protein SufT [Gammaproteobacteria bacterium]
MHPREPITLSRDCEAILIPAGDPITLRSGSVVHITQALGGSYTVYAEGNLARIAGRDLDALGLQPAPEQSQPTVAQGDGQVDEDQIWEQLRTCYDPEIPINIVELGLVYDCVVTPIADAGHRVSVSMTLTAPGCGMGEVLVEDVKRKIAQVPNVTEVEVDLVFDPPWNQDMMSEAARLEAGMY